MLLARVRLVALILFATAWPLAAQVHEVEEPMDLARGLALKVDAVKPGVPLGEAAQTGVGVKDFALAMTVPMPTPLRDAILAGQGDDAQGWRLVVTTDGALRFEARVKGRTDPFVVSTPPGSVAPGSTHHVAVNVLREAARPSAGIWRDGVELASGIVPPVDLGTPQALSAAEGAREVRLYLRGLNRPELLALWLDAAGRGKPVAKHPAPPANGPRFVPQQDETIALIGGTEAVALAESGELEALLLMAFPETRFRFRCLAWEGDTVFRQDRPMNFGDLEQQLRRVNAGTVFVMFGRQECLDLPEIVATDEMSERFGEFSLRFTALLQRVKRCTPNCIVVAPPDFDKKQQFVGRNFMAKNNRLRSYARMMKSAATAEGALCWVGLDLWADAITDFDVKNAYTHDGVNLTAAGCADTAKRITTNLLGGDSSTAPTSISEELLSAIRAKNRLWHDYWRPTNWAFLHGDRTQQPSSRDHVNPQLRFFPAEQEKYLPLIKEAEEKIYKLVEEATKKLP